MLYTFDVHRAMDTIGLYLMATCVFSLTNAQVSDGCKNPLGMKSGRILDRQLTSSSAYTDSLPYVYDETEGRLDGGSCWIANNLNNQWIQVDFNTPMYVSGIVLQGGPYYWNPAWVTAYKVHYGIDDSSNWQNVKDENHDDMVFRGNSDRNSHVTNLFTSEVRVTRIRIRPTEWHEYVSMRFEILGCEETCINQLGMKDGTILDRQITASSEYNANHGPTNARLDRPAGNGRTGAWSASSNDISQWIQVEFDTLRSVSGIVLQGRSDNEQWVTKYKVQYSNDGGTWQYIQDNNNVDRVFTGNSDRDGHVTSIFFSAISAGYIKIRPTEWHRHISMRFELLGCDDINECDRNPCMNGECQESPNQYTCICDAGWTGYNCDQDINECANSPCVNGQCEDGINQYTCVCNEGWTGKTCNENINECPGSPCVYGQCEDGINQYTCVCDAGWSGTICDENTNECDSSPCMNGRCQDGTNQYTCICADGWTGYNCDQEAATTRASVVTSIATSSESVTKEFSVTTTTTIGALASKAFAMSSGSASTAAGASIASIVLLLIIGGVVLIVMKRRKRQQHPESSKSQTVVQLDGPYGDTVTNIITSPPTRDPPIYAGVTDANRDAVAIPPTDEMYQDVSDKPSEVQQGTDETYQDITEEAKVNPSTHDDDIYQDVQDDEYTYAHVDTVRDKVPSVDGDLVQIYAKSQYGGALHSAENGNQQEGWVDNDIYAMSDEDPQLKRQPVGDNKEEGWVENDIYARSDEDQLKRQGEENDEEEGWMDNSIYATTDE